MLLDMPGEKSIRHQSNLNFKVSGAGRLRQQTRMQLDFGCHYLSLVISLRLAFPAVKKKKKKK